MQEPDKLQPGEDPDTSNLGDAEHWLGVYAELLGFKDRLINEAEAATDEVSQGSKPEVEHDLSMLDGEKQRLARRYFFWRQRVDELRTA